jgi:hypothetical protein
VKKFFVFAFFVLFGAGAFADTWPPPGGERFFLYGHPAYTSSANSAAGGPLFSAGPYSININPALTAGLQCPVADFGVSVLADTADPKAGSALHLGASYPTRWGVWTGALRGEFLDLNSMPIGNVVAGHAGFARDVTANLYIGAGLSAGGLFNDETQDFYAAVDLGIWYRIQEIEAIKNQSLLKNIRFGAAFQNIGKSFNKYRVGDYELEYDPGFPGIFKPKAGVAADLLSFDKFKLGLSTDVSFPAFSNFVLDAGARAEIADMFYIASGWDFNARENDKGYGSHWSFLTVGVKFQIDTSGVKALRKNGIEQTDIQVDALWQHLHENTEHISIGATANFGAKDSLPPDIEIGQIQYEK